MILWANLHGSAVIGTVIPLSYAAARVLDRFFRPEKTAPAGSMRTLWIVAGLCLLAPLATPYGIKTIALPLGHFRTMAEGFKAFSVDRHAMRLSDLRRQHAPFAAMLLLGLVALAANWRRAEWTDVAWMFALGALAIISVRFASLFAVVAAPIVAANLSRGFASAGKNADRPAHRTAWQVGSVALLMTAFVLAGLFRPGAERLRTGLKPRVHPEAEVAFLDEAGIEGPLLNEPEFGGYIVWCSPRRRVFVDTRGPARRQGAYSPEFFRTVTELFNWTRGPIEKSFEVWQREINRYHINAAIVQRPDVVAHFDGSDQWAMVYAGPVAFVYVRRARSNDGIIERFGYNVVPAQVSRGLLEQLAGDPQAAPLAEADLRRRKAQDPNGLGANLMLAYWWKITGQTDKAVAAYEAIAAAWPELHEAHRSLDELRGQMGQ